MKLAEPIAEKGQILDWFLAYVAEKGLELYPAQEEAILELIDQKNVILNTPTGSGKSLVALALHYDSFIQGRKSVYTCPIKALVNEKFLSLCKEFGPDQVGMITGDATVNPDAPILCCTAEILANFALRVGEDLGYSDIVVDEFHYYSDRERGMAWQIPLLTLKKSRFLLMSATLGDTAFFEKELTLLNGKPTVLIQSQDRPVPLDYEYRETPLHETVGVLIDRGRFPIYLVNFTQRQCAEVAQNFLSIDFCTKEEKRAIAEAIEGTDFESPYGKEIKKVIKHGIGIHHGGLLPKYRILIERLAHKGLLKIISGTDTLGVGVNVPIRTVLFTQLCKYDGSKTSLLTVRDFKQISGRAGRKGFDSQGSVVAQAPEHVIENIRMEAKGKKFTKRKPPEHGYVQWGKDTFEKLINGQPEGLISRFDVSHSLLLNVLSRKEKGYPALKEIIRKCHEPQSQKPRLRKKGFELFRSLVDRNIIEYKPLKINVDLQEDFSLNHALALYLIDTLGILDSTKPDYVLDLLTLVESIAENPEVILRRQLDKIKTLKMAEMKAEGIDYDQRIEELDKLEYPKPNREFIYSTFNEFLDKHPWVGQENIRPKSIAREMFELYLAFGEYVREYDLHRVEGLVLRYLSEVYKILVQTVPEPMKTEEVQLMIEYFRTMIKDIDSSLVDEWERMRNPEFVPVKADTSARDAALELKKRQKEQTIQIRNTIFKWIRMLAAGEGDAFLQHSKMGISLDALTTLMNTYLEDHIKIMTDAQARNPRLMNLDFTAGTGTQILVDSEGHNDWILTLDLSNPEYPKVVSMGPI